MRVEGYENQTYTGRSVVFPVDQNEEKQHMGSVFSPSLISKVILLHRIIHWLRYHRPMLLIVLLPLFKSRNRVCATK